MNINSKTKKANPNEETLKNRKLIQMFIEYVSLKISP